MAGEAAVAVGLGALAEEEYLTQRVNELIQLYRRLQELRQRILQEVEEKRGRTLRKSPPTSLRQYGGTRRR
jgi:hypothetical protein